MSSPRVQKYFEAMPQQIKNLGGYTYNFRTVIVWQGRVTTGPNAGKDAMVMDIDSATWADNNRRVLILATPASDLNATAAMKTQSHAAGNYIDGSVRFAMYVETPESWTNAQAYFTRAVEHHLRGQLGSPVEVFYGANDVQPILEGVNGGTSGQETTSTFVSAGTDIPALWPAPGGV